MPRSIRDCYRRFGSTYTLKMEAANTTETLVTISNTTERRKTQSQFLLPWRFHSILTFLCSPSITFV